MSDLLPFIVVGVVSGSLYGLAGTGLTLTYRTTGVFNFAHGAIAAAAAFLFSTVHVDWGVPWIAAGVLVVLGVGAVGGVVVERLTRNASQWDTAQTVVVTVGLLLAVQGLVQWRYGAATRQMDPFVHGTLGTIGDVTVSAQQGLAVGLAAVAAVGLYAFLRTSLLGARMRAVVDDPSLLDLTGADPNRVRRASWIVGSAFAALSGVLISPFLGLDATLLTLLVVQAFGAVAIGRFASIPATYLGGIALGVGASLLTKWVADTPSLGGLPSALPFLVLFVALLVSPPKPMARASSGREGDARSASSSLLRTAPASARAVAVAAGVAVLLLVPTMVGAKLPVFTTAAGFVVVFASLALLVRTSGQISLCHASFCAVGATSFAHLAGSSGLGLPWPVALVLAGLAVVPIGAIVAIPAIRLSGVHLALATFGFAILMERVVYPLGVMFGSVGSREAPRPSFARSDDALFFVTAAVAVGACVLVALVVRTRLGRLLRGIAESPTALRTNGLGVNVVRVVVFAISAFLAGLAGALFASASGAVSGQGFGSFNSLLYLVVLAVAGRALVPSAVVAALALAVAPAYLPDGFVEHRALLFGALTVLIVVGRDVTIRRPGGRTAARLATSPARARLARLA